MIYCQITVCQCLCFNSLRRIDDQDCTLTGCQTPGYLIVKIHMSRRVDQIEDIFLSILCLVDNTHSLCLDRNASLPLKIHIV